MGAPVRYRSDQLHTSHGVAAPRGDESPPPGSPGTVPPTTVVDFGPPMRALFNFGATYTPLNHGSYGTYPVAVFEARQQKLRDYEARSDIYKRFTYPPLLREARATVAPLLGAATDEVVFVPNATTGVNTVLRNLAPLISGRDDVVLYFGSVYPACLKTLLSLGEEGAAGGSGGNFLTAEGIDVVYPVEDDELVDALRARAVDLAGRGKKVRLAIFDTIVSGPGVRVPWERLVAACRELGILSLVDGAHGIGHIDMTHTGRTVQPDFLVTNCHKWLFVPRGCAVLYVPFRNQHYIKTTLPTSHGYEPPEVRAGLPTTEYFTNLFVDVATADNSTYLCVIEALRFRDQVCGGEERIRAYSFRLAAEGGDRAARILGTEVLDNRSGSIRRCCFANVLLPLVFIPEEEGSGGEEGQVEEEKGQGDGEGEGEGEGGVPLSEAQAIFDWIYKTAAEEFDTYFQIKYYKNQFWVRFSAQVYIGVEDFEWGARTLLELCRRVKSGEWKAS